MKVGGILRACRERSGMTQEELADRLYISQSDISKYENDKKEPTITLFQAWIMNTQATEVAVAYLLGIDGVNILQQLLPLIGGIVAWLPIF